MKLDVSKKYSLALGGGAARGLAHVGVLRYIEENDINITEISGTSMGAIVGAMFALGMSSKEIEQFSIDIRVIKLIDLDFKKGLLKGKKISKKLEEIFGDKNIEDLNIKLKIVSTNLETGDKYIFAKGSIVDALRSSISLPGIFIPNKIGDTSYVDGGINSNLPIEVLDGKNIIAVSALKNITGKLKTKNKFLGIEIDKTILSLSYQILHRTIIIMMRQNEERSIATGNKNIIVLKPDFGNLDYYNFDKISDLVTIGYKEAKITL